MAISKELQIGKAGEYLVCSDLIIRGFIAYPSEQGLPYDVVLDNGNKLIKVQVKTTMTPRTIPQRASDRGAYIYNIKRNGRMNTSTYNECDVDIFALVALDTKQIGYVNKEQMVSTVILRDDRERGNYYDEKGYNDYMKSRSLYNNGMSRKDISNALSINYSSVCRYVSKGYTPIMSNAKYFSDIIVCDNWFKEL